MKKKILIPLIIGIAVIIGVVLFLVFKSSGNSYYNIKITDTMGNVTIDRDGNSIEAYEEFKMRDKDYIRVGSDGFTRIDCDRETFSHFEHDTEASFDADSDKKLVINLVKGEMVVEVQKELLSDESLTVQTPNTTLAIRGTVIAVKAVPTDDGGVKTINYCLEGKADVEINGVTETIEAGEGWLTITDDQGNITESQAVGAEEFEFANIDINTLKGADDNPMTLRDSNGAIINKNSGPTLSNGDIVIDGNNFPDMIFRLYIMDQIDSDKNGVLSSSELEEKYINVSSSGMTDLKGIEFFTELTTLKCSSNELVSLDLSKNTKLTSLDCSKNSILKLDLSQNTLLEYLDCSANPLITLDVSNNTQLKYLYCYDDQLNNLDVSSNLLLETLYCGSNQISNIDISKNTALVEFSCYNTFVSNVDVTNNKNLALIICSSTGITTLDVSKNPDLKQLEFSFTGISEIDLSNNPKLESLDCMYTELTSLDIRNNPLLSPENILYDQGKNTLIQ